MPYCILPLFFFLALTELWGADTQLTADLKKQIEAVHVIGVEINSLVEQNGSVRIDGIANSNESVAKYMQILQSSIAGVSVDLSEIKVVKTEEIKKKVFSLSLQTNTPRENTSPAATNGFDDSKYQELFALRETLLKQEYQVLLKAVEEVKKRNLLPNNLTAPFFEERQMEISYRETINRESVTRRNLISMPNNEREHMLAWLRRDYDERKNMADSPDAVAKMIKKIIGFEAFEQHFAKGLKD